VSRAATSARILALVLLGLVALGSPKRYRPEFYPSNETGRVHAAMAIIDHGTVHLDDVWDDVHPQWRNSRVLPNCDASVKDGHFLLDKPPGTTFLVLPVIALLRGFDVDPEFTSLLWLLSLLFAALPSVLFMLAFRRWLRQNLPSSRAMRLVAPAVIVATPWLLFGSQLMGHTLAASLAGIGAFLALGRLDAEEPDTRSAPRAFLGGLALGGAVLSETSSALIALGVIGAILLDPARRHRWRWVVLGGIAPALAFLVWNAVSFGNPFRTGYAYKAAPSMAAAHERGLFGLTWPRGDGLFGLMLSSRRGLFFLSPWLILGPVGAVWASFDRRVSRAWRALLLFATLGVPVLLSGFSDWHGGQTVGPRYLVFVLPFFGIGAALAVQRIERGRFRLPALSILSGLLLSSLALLLVALAGIPAVMVEIANPIVELVVPVLLEAGPLGTVWDPLVGPLLGVAITVAAACALLVFAALRTRRDSGERTPAQDPVRTDRAPTPARRLAAFLVVAAAVGHLAVVALPRTRGPDARSHVLTQQLYAYTYMGKEEPRRRVVLELLRMEEEKRKPR